MYVDESGDPGITNSPTRYFTLSGLVINETRWQSAMGRVADFRQRMRSAFGLQVREEIHSARFITSPGPLVRIPRHDRLAILRHFADELARMSELSVINVVVDKQDKPTTYDVFEHAWRALVQRFENTLIHNNFPNAMTKGECGMVFADGQPSAKLIAMYTRMRDYNPVPNQTGGGYRNIVMRKIIEDPCFRDSAHSLLIQAADLVAFLLYQQEQPNQYMRKSGGAGYFSRLTPILCRRASPRDPQGIVRL
ncbi:MULTISPECIES: DUF3800 domain-containing protein [Luteibacter]|jgi:hypothetical protein|uniref:DUF3800 domain-containing protein n=1 Tax=Luteibacter sp. dw_328 TaxID=2719796 RepID=UPI001BD67106|nr:MULTISPECIES: DUF3800 domain-containing protein [Luteibacter]